MEFGNKGRAGCFQAVCWSSRPIFSSVGYPFHADQTQFFFFTLHVEMATQSAAAVPVANLLSLRSS
ncbi:MAG: hypothetical protein GEU77_16220 [Deltaproteobacteria bacterium]|nr:hypothetical protein [Deltaproteobacteria bacterium]